MKNNGLGRTFNKLCHLNAGTYFLSHVFANLTPSKHDPIADLSSFWKNAAPRPFEHKNCCQLHSVSSFLATIPRPFWIFVEGPKDIWSRVCTPHVQGPPAGFSPQLPGMGTDTPQLLARSSRKGAAAERWGWWFSQINQSHPQERVSPAAVCWGQCLKPASASQTC